MSEHTPGPWKVEDFDPDYVDKSIKRIHIFNGMFQVASAVGDDFETRQVNARLIAAAPDMLGACRSALRALEDNVRPGPMDEDAKAGLCIAITRATGRAFAKPCLACSTGAMAGPIPGALSNGERCDTCKVYPSDKAAREAIREAIAKAVTKAKDVHRSPAA